ncbi:phage capsid protein [Oceaniglobus trochenteri]|uniref:phage capsid protein n=1 Tax=Oceaniglobus trochenteri TaxID=2763260 RepID=UPI001CFF83B9|nr:phage capsid protein [Oceaniglobus trochenteri]
MSYQQLVEAHHRLTYQSNIMMVAQQTRNPLREAVTVVDADGEAQSIADLVGKTDYIEGEDYSRRNPDNPPERSRRWLVRPKVIETGQYITKEEKFDQAMDPTSMLSKNTVVTVERGVYDRILGVRKQGKNGPYVVAGGGILGSVAEGKTPGTAVALPSGNILAADLGDSGTSHGLTALKLRAATEAMELEEFGLETDMQIFGLITPKQKTDLINLALETKTSLNPFDVENIREGKPGRLLGINWMFTNRLPTNSAGHRMCPIWSKENIIAGFWQDVQGDMWNDTAAKNLPYIYADAYVDAARVEDGGVRVVLCAET